MFNIFSKNEYAKSTDEELLMNFRSESWAAMDEKRQISVCQELENRNAKSQGRQPCKVSSSRDEGAFGCYYLKSNRIEVNLEDLNGKNTSYNVLDTVYHEGRHAYQQHCLDKGVKGLPKETLDMCDLENKPHVYSGQIRYEYCSSEIDSNNAAARKLTEHKALFYDDKAYESYINQSWDNMHRQNACRNELGRREEQMKAIENTYKLGYISENQKNDLKSTFGNASHKEPVIEDAKKVENELYQTRQAIQQKKHESRAQEVSYRR
jgi:hypothetical protein